MLNSSDFVCEVLLLLGLKSFLCLFVESARITQFVLSEPELANLFF